MPRRFAIASALARAVLPVLLALLLVGPFRTDRLLGQGETNPGLIANMVAWAKRNGLAAVTDPIYADDDLALDDPDVILRRNSIAVVTPTTDPVKHVVLRDDIFTWRVLHIDRALTAGLQPASRCSQPPPLLPRPTLGAQEIIVPLLGGTVDVDGVRVTLTSPDDLADFAPGHAYLAILALCADGQARLAHLGNIGVFEISSSGRFIETPTHHRPISKAIVSMGTVEALIEHLRRIGK